MSRREPNWIAACCGLVYIICFLFLPVYTVSFVLPLKGLLLIFVAPVVVILIACGLAMSLSSLLLDKKISMCVGGGCALITLLFGILGNHVLPVHALTSLVDQGISEVTGSAMSLGFLINVGMGFGLILCMLICVVHIVLELLLDSTPRTRPVEPDLWEQPNSGTIDF